MKVRAKREIPKATKIFTDREEPRATFWKNYNHFKQEMQSEGEIRVLAYYGIGGIGKSSLLNRLQEEMEEKIAQPKYVYFDFNIAQDLRSVLDYIRGQLARKYNFKFSLYDLGIYSYAQKIGEDIKAPEIQGFIDNSPLLACAVEAVGSIPVAGMAIQLLKAADKGVVFIRNIVNDHKKELTEIEYKKPTELYEYLPYLFAQDIADNLNDADEPLLIFLDTYERLVNEMSPFGEPLNNDLWLRGEDGLIQNMPNVMWIIAGREKLKWEHFDSDWRDALEQHILGNLSRSDADNFLRVAGISESKLRHDIYKLTNGTPVYLDLCVDRYVSLNKKHQDITIGDFGKNVYSLVERFARYLDDTRKDIVYMLSCLMIWNDYMIAEIGNKIIPGFSITTYEKVKEYSFITKSDKYNFNMHQTVGSIFLDSCPTMIKEATIKQAVEYCRKQMDSHSVFDSKYSYHLQWLLKFGVLHYGNGNEMVSFYKDNIKNYIAALSESGQSSLTSVIFEPFLTVAKLGNNRRLYDLALSESASFKIDAGKYDEGTAFAEQSVDIYRKYYGTEDINVLGKDKDALSALRRLALIYRAVGRYADAYSIDRKILPLFKKELGEKEPETITVMNGTYIDLSKLGHYPSALKMIKNVIVLRKEVLGEKHVETINAMNNLGILLKKMGQYEKALSIREKVLELRKEVLGEKHPDTISTMSNIAYVLREMGQYEKALKIREEVLAMRKEVLGEKHPDTISAMNNIASIYKEMGQYEKAFSIWEQILGLRKEVLGEKHPDTISAMNNITAVLVEMGQYEKALSIREEVLSMRKEVLGEKHPDTIAAMNGIAYVLREMGQYEKALSIREEVLTLRKEVLGEKHPNTISAMNNITAVLVEMGQYEKALSIREEVLSMRKEVLGEKHPDTIAAMNGIAYVLREMGQYEKALSIREEVLAMRKEVLGEKHPDTISAMNNIAAVLVEMGQYEKALTIREEVLAMRKEMLGEKHPDTISVMNAIAWDYHMSGDSMKGVPFAEKIDELEKQIKDIPEQDRISHRDTLAVLYSDIGRDDEALTIAIDLLDMIKEKNAYDSVSIAERNITIAYCLHNSERNTEALEYCDRGIGLLEEAGVSMRNLDINPIELRKLIIQKV